MKKHLIKQIVREDIKEFDLKKGDIVYKEANIKLSKHQHDNLYYFISDIYDKAYN